MIVYQHLEGLIRVAYNNVWCEDSVIISDTEGAEPDITLESCQQKCLGEASCNFMFFGIEAYSCLLGTEKRCVRSGIYANRCALFETCERLSDYTIDSGRQTSIYRLITGKKNND